MHLLGSNLKILCSAVSILSLFDREVVEPKKSSHPKLRMAALENSSQVLACVGQWEERAYREGGVD